MKIDNIELYKRLALGLCTSLAINAVGCGTDAPTATANPDASLPDPNVDAPTAPPPVFAKRPSKSSTIAISPDDSIVAMVNPDDGTISVFQTSDNSRLSKVATGKNPSSIVIAGDGKTAYVANRDDNTVVRVVNINGGTPTNDAAVNVGSSPVGLALSPSGLRLFVAEFAESNISVIDTTTMNIVDKIAFDRPRALVVTNNGDESDDDEILAAAKFYGLPVAGKEAKDDGRTGQVVTWPLTALHTPTKISLAPIDSGFKNGGGITAAGEVGVTTSPNQLASMAVNSGKLYITSVSASPEGPTRFDNNVFPVVYVADLAAGTEVRDASGTANLARKIIDLIPTPTAAAPRFIPGDLSDIAFLDNTTLGYSVSKAGDVMVRMLYGDTLAIGAEGNGPKEIDLAGNATIGLCQAPTGLVTSAKLSGAYVNCWASRRLGFVNFKTQTLDNTFEASPVNVNAVAESIRRGERFYFTGRARWSSDGTTKDANGVIVTVGNGAKGGEGWSSCGSCHPDGLTDNITWIFGTGPRQTTSMDGSFSHGPGIQKQRVFNWTAVNDELHDFEANVRGVSGGLGAITQPATGGTAADCTKFIPLEQAATANGPMLASNKALAATVGCVRSDWDDITAFVKTITPAHVSKLADAAAIGRGQTLFIAGGCPNCHSGTGWTVSSVPYKAADSVAFGATSFTPKAFLSTVMYTAARPQISAQPPVATGDDTGPAEAGTVQPLQLACALRNVGTFGVRDPAAVNKTNVAATDALELRSGGGRAQGRGGYNVPSLYGLALGAPYLHHGQAATLTDLFTDPKWDIHTNAGNFNFSKQDLAVSGAVADLTAFLRSIDAETTEIAIPTSANLSFDACSPD